MSFILKSALFALVALFSVGTILAQENLSAPERKKLVDLLVSALDERGSWMSVHAAEALISMEQTEPVRAAFEPQTATATAPYRIGVWRVLARSASTEQQRQKYVEKIRAVMLNPAATDRTHAFEALAKITAPFSSQSERLANDQMATGPTNAAPFAAWRMATETDSNTKGIQRIVDLLHSPDPICRARAADALAHLKINDAQVLNALETALLGEAKDSLARPFIIAAIGGHAVLELAQSTEDSKIRTIAINSLPATGTRNEIDWLWKTLNDQNVDVQVACASALLHRYKSSHAKNASTPTATQPAD